MRCSLLGIIAATLLPSPARAQQQARPITNGGAPQVSADGRHIAFYSNRGGPGAAQFYVIAEDGSGTVQLTNSPASKSGPRWTHDGSRVVFSMEAGDTSKVFTIAPDGSDQRQIGIAIGRSPLLSPDGQRLLVSTGPFATMQFAEAGLDGTVIRQISDGTGANFNAVYSPEGRRIAYAHSDSPQSLQVWVMNVDGSGARALTNFASADGRPQWPAWSPDGRSIAVQSGVYERGHPEKHIAHIWVIDVATGAAQKLAAHDIPYIDETPSWFPDGRRIAFQSNRTGRLEIWVMSADGSGARQITR